MAAEEKPAQIGAGTVEIELDGKTHQLKPTYEACVALSNRPGGIAQLIAGISQFQMEAYQIVIGEGLNANPGQRERLLGPAIFKAGMINLAAPCIRFLRGVANGGRIPDEEDDEEDRESAPLAESASASQSTIDA